jgi:hypothetical protein
LRISAKKFTAVIVSAGLVMTALVGGSAAAAPAPPKSCEVAGPKPVANPSYTAGTPLPEQHDANLANNRIVVETFGDTIVAMAQHLECKDGDVVVVDTPISDTSVTWVSMVKGTDARGSYVDFTLRYIGSPGVQFIQSDESLAESGTVHTSNPMFGHQSDGYYHYTTRAYFAGSNVRWVSADVYVRRAGGVIFAPMAQANTAKVLAAKSGRWPNLRQF